MRDDSVDMVTGPGGRVVVKEKEEIMTFRSLV
jgi:hypothetical protein